MKALPFPLALLAVILVSCAKPAVPPSVDAGAAAVCSNAAKLGCPFGTDSHCAAGIAAGERNGDVDAPTMACAALAKSAAALEACGPYFAGDCTGGLP